ncbi:MAG: NADH-quinone oxidoreductase subunit J [Pseudomonadota bacterium]
MTAVDIFFYVFASLLIGSGVMVISARNPVHAVLFLILAFFCAAGLFILLGAEFLAMMLIIVYVGAVMVLFLFVIMMLDVDFAELRSGWTDYAPTGALIGIVVLLQLLYVLGVYNLDPQTMAPPQAAVPAAGTEPGSARAIGQVLYTDFILYFQLAGLILFLAMIGAIVLTLRERSGVRRQSISAQVARTRKDGVASVDVPAGGAILPEAPRRSS